ncbi:aminotransferase class III-fold pyridoxal phosphate-dependent enzyme [Cohnella sp. CFH 77786]|uniref:aminotransferase class III-fold pyridoxal phosphate-dependent enzyme n=1 Tax=Cohnella sp. CFH 77786 TaxID=2662265 RepID=UPI001C60AD21|nr:aminotransferase class III-fold pyridoxal phosphate-dependent enzyme [Cohnella sp. CFH 77786]MBW5448354.1 aminotransferase class III-fold pyridoxal phosphate-dependent enzyme [Cohnella sp. CFH 77786]
MTARYLQSERLLERALHTIPLGSQTFSKSKTQYPYGVSPYFIEKGLGSRVWDADGNEYIDFVNGLGAVLLGYRDPDVDEAVKRQMESGVSFSLPHRLEMQVAEKLTELIPCAEMVRFGKNGSDATAGAVRLARAYTSRERVAVCGYHGWQDWYIGSTARHLGVPQAVRELTHPFVFNRLDTLEQLFRDYPAEFAAVILEPMNTTEPTPEFLHGIQALCRKHGTVLIFDETVTGFRYDIGGAQRLFGVTPDLATFGKGMGNGYPISAIVGKREIMMVMEDIFFSFTFGGETLSLAAALATLRKLETYPVVSTIQRLGRRIMDGIRSMIGLYGLESVLTVSGNPAWSFLGIRDSGRYSSWEIKTFFLQEMLARGILILGSHNMSYSHTEEDAARLLLAYDEVLQELETALIRGDLEKRLRCKPLEPLFRVR